MLLKILTGAFVALAMLLGGCSVSSWETDATEGEHHTTWNHGFEIAVSGWGIYIGPGRNSTTTVDNKFTATADGEGENSEDEGE